MRQDAVTVRLATSERTPSIALLIATAALGQFAGNIYAPSLPSVARDLGVTNGSAQLSVAAFFAPSRRHNSS